MLQSLWGTQNCLMSRIPKGTHAYQLMESCLVWHTLLSACMFNTRTQPCSKNRPLDHVHCSLSNRKSSEFARHPKRSIAAACLSSLRARALMHIPSKLQHIVLTILQIFVQQSSGPGLS